MAAASYGFVALYHRVKDADTNSDPAFCFSQEERKAAVTSMRTIPEKYSNRLNVSLVEAAEMLGLRPKTLYNQVSAGNCPIPTVKFGGRRFVRLDDLRALTHDEYPLTTPPTAARSINRRG